MNRFAAKLLLLPIAFAVAAAAPLRAGDQPSPRDLFPQATAAAQAHDLEGAAKRTGQLLEIGKAYGIKSYPVFAESAAGLSRQASAEKNKPLSDWAAAAALGLDPSSPAVAFNLADAAAGRRDWSSASRLIAGGIRGLFGRYRWRALTRADLLTTSCLAIALTAAVFAIILFARYFRPAAHDFREMLGGRFRGGSVTLLAFALLFLPIFLWLGPTWLLLYWLVIFFGYASGAERVTTIVLCLLLAFVPVLLDAAAHTIAGVDNAVVAAAISSAEQSYQPEALRRLEELSAVVGDNAEISLLLGNLQMQEGNESGAAISYRRSSEIGDSAGAHVNIGNLHFLNNDFGAAITKYEEAEKLDPKLAIAYYNHSVASGETYKYDEQAELVKKVRAADPALLDRLMASAPPQKVAWYNPPIGTAWRIADTIARKGTARDVFANYASFDPAVSVMNPLTAGSLLTSVLAVLLWLKRRRTGYAGACIKCGRTFCHRCKSSRESATYCTQCIHIYLKRDGVSLDTKRQKLEEVQSYQSGATIRNRIFTTLLPGSGQLLEGRTVVGVLALFVFVLFVVLAVATGRLAPVLNPGETVKWLLRGAAIAVALLVWLFFSIPVYRRKVVG